MADWTSGDWMWPNRQSTNQMLSATEGAVPTTVNAMTAADPESALARGRAPPALSPGPAPTGRDKIFDALYSAFGGKPENRWAADKLTTALDWGTLGMLTGAYDGGHELASTGRPSALAMALMPGARVPGAAVKGAVNAAKTLAMDDASRLGRAREMGFDTDTRWFHGSPHSDLEQISPGMRDPGAWFTTDAQNAGNYAKGTDGKIYDAHLKTKRPFVVESLSENEFVPSHAGVPLELDNNVDIVRHAQRNGYDSVHFPIGNFTESGNTMVVFDPAQIRSTDAAFDPAKKASGNLLGSHFAPIGIGGGVLGLWGLRDHD